MSKRIMHMIGFGTLLAMLLSLLTPQPVSAPASNAMGVDVSGMQLFQAEKFDAHYRMPHEGRIETLLQEAGILSLGADRATTELAVQAFVQAFAERNPTTVSPLKLRKLMAHERQREYIQYLTPETIPSLVVPVEFTGTDTFIYNGTDPDTGACVDMEVTTSGPLHNEIAPPGPRDNNTVWYDDTNPELYDELYFGVGPEAGVIVNHPNLGPVDLRGNTMANYYLEQSEGKFVTTGLIFPMWVQSVHSEGYYGADSCESGSHNVRAPELVRETVDLINAADPTLAWQDFDADGDGIVDNYTVIHAGMGQESGGGEQGDFAIWSHASLLDWPTGYLACAAGSAGCPDRDIYVREYSMDPENIDVGVIAEEFGHAAFGLPDIYTTDYQTSVANWSIMESGSWNGPLGGMQPAPFPLYFRYIIGWAEPFELDYDAPPKLAIVGQHSLRPKFTQQGMKINLPDQDITFDNPLGTGQAWWSDTGDLLSNTLMHEFDLTTATAPIFSFASYWSIEEDWDYGYVEVSLDGGATWMILPDMDGVLTDTDPNGNNNGWGLTGEGMGILRFDLAPFAGLSVWVRLRYSTDLAVQWDGWWADDFTVEDGGAVLFYDDVEAPPGDWVVDGWRIVPVTDIFPRYYLVEWRNASGFDRGLQYPYQTVYSDDDEWEVDRAPYTVPGMLLWYRDTAYGFDYTLSDSWYDSPSWGPKHALLVVDSHPFPHGWDTVFYSSGAPFRVSARVEPQDATFTLQDTTPFTLRLGYDPATGEFLDEPIETKTFEPRAGVRQFHDSLGYYPGIYYSEITDGLYWWDIDASMVVPATGDYTTRITDLNEDPFYPLYGLDLGGTFLGSGNPGDEDVQFGMHLAVVGMAHDGSWGAIRFWNAPALFDLQVKAMPEEVRAGNPLIFLVKLRNNSPISQHFVLDNPIPEGTTFWHGPGYDPDTNSIHIEGNLHPNRQRVLRIVVRVNHDLAPGTEIVNETWLTDDALGAYGAATATVK